MEGGSGGGDSEVQRTMLELLNQLDGFEAHQNIKVIVHILMFFVMYIKVAVYQLLSDSTTIWLILLLLSSKHTKFMHISETKATKRLSHMSWF